MTVSLVGRMAIGSAKSDFPDFVTQATCNKEKVSQKKIDRTGKNC